MILRFLDFDKYDNIIINFKNVLNISGYFSKNCLTGCMRSAGGRPLRCLWPVTWYYALVLTGKS